MLKVAGIAVAMFALCGMAVAHQAEGRTVRLVCAGADWDSVWGSLTTAMHPTITLILPAKLPANLPYNGSGNVTPLSWSASDGELKWNSKSTKYPWMTTWAFGTDSQANITIFQIGIYYESSDYNTWLYVNETSLDGGDSSAIQQNYPKLPQSGAYGVGSTCSYK